MYKSKIVSMVAPFLFMKKDNCIWPLMNNASLRKIEIKCSNIYECECNLKIRKKYIKILLWKLLFFTFMYMIHGVN